MSDAKLNLGCGEDYRDGWVNVDVVPECDPDLGVNLSSFPWPFAAASFDRILASHVFEHLPSIGDALAECGRILRPGGTVDIRLPTGSTMRLIKLIKPAGRGSPRSSRLESDIGIEIRDWS